MALNSVEQDHISDNGEFAKVCEAFYMRAILRQEQWYGAGDFDTTITQGEIDAVPSFLEAGVTVNDLTEMNYISAQFLALLTTQRLAVIVKMANLP